MTDESKIQEAVAKPAAGCSVSDPANTLGSVNTAKACFEAPTAQPPGRSKIPKDAFNHKNNADGLLIRAADTSKPSQFANLPTEIRLQIYSYILPAQIRPDLAQLGTKSSTRRYGFTTLFQICRLVTHETLYEFYSTVHVRLRPVTLDDDALVVNWFRSLGRVQGQALSMNPNITVALSLSIADGSLDCGLFWFNVDLAVLCLESNPHMYHSYYAPFGSIDQVSREDRAGFVGFCRLIKWCLGCVEIAQGLNWSYDFYGDTNQPADISLLENFFAGTMETTVRESLWKGWTKGRKVGDFKVQALRLFEALDQAMRGLIHARDSLERGNNWSWPTDEEWFHDVQDVRQVLTSDKEGLY